MYYENSYMECYYFYKYCGDHFDIAETKKNQRILFAKFFLKDRIFYY